MKPGYLILILMLIIVLIGVISEIAGALPGYNYYTKYEFTNNGTQTYSAPINFEVNASGMIDGYYIKSDASDIDVTYLGQREYLTAMDLTSGSATWRFQHTTIPTDGQAIKVMWYGHNTETRDQHWIAATGDVLTIPNNQGSFNFATYGGGAGTQPFAVQMNIQPQAYPGTKQLIIGLGDSWKLELYPQSNTTEEPWYKWSVMSGSANVVHSVTITANVYEMVNLWAWYNGTDIVVSDGVYHKNTPLPVGMVDPGTAVYPQMCAADLIVDDLRITTPGSVSAPAGGLPDGYSAIYQIGPDTTKLLTDSPGYCDGYACASSDPDAPGYLVNGTIYETDTNNYNYGWIYIKTLGSYYHVDIDDTYPGDPTDTISGVSVTIGGWMNSNDADIQREIKCYIYKDENTPGQYSYPTEYLYTNGENKQYFTVTTGTRTLAWDDQPWTIDKLTSTRLQISNLYVYGTEGYIATPWHFTEIKLNVGVE